MAKYGVRRIYSYLSWTYLKKEEEEEEEETLNS